MELIEIKDLTYTYPGASVPILRHMNLTVERGDFLAIIGNNGCGKSTLCKTMNGLIPHFISGEMEGKVFIDGVDTCEMDVGSIAKKVGYVYQDFENQIVRPTVLDDASYACMNYAMPDYLEKGREALRQCGLEGREDEYIWQLSGGQIHLLALAGAVALQPDVLILDEPIAQLDPGHADRIYEILKDLNENYGKTIIVIEHHTEYIADYCHHVALLKDGEVRWVLPADEALRRVEELEESDIFPPQVAIAADRLAKEGIFPEGEKLPTTVEEGKKAFASLRFCGIGNVTDASNAGDGIAAADEPDAGDGKFQEETPDGNMPDFSEKEAEPAAEFRDLTVSYRSVKGQPKTIFHHMNLKIRRGEKIALIGSNGAGKSTTMKLLTGLIRPSEGEVLLNGQEIRDTKPEELSRSISLVYQNPEEMFIKDSIENDIAFAMRAHGEEDWEKRTEELLAQFRLTELKDRDGRLLSGGQMRRASLAIGIALKPQILLLDEPTANLDIATRKEILDTLKKMKGITDTVMIATHDMQLVCEWAERIIVLCGGEVVADGSRNEIFGNEDVLKKTGIRPPEIFTMGQELNRDAYCYTVGEFLEQFGG